VTHRPPLGQHFLRDMHLVETIVHSAELGPEDIALEIGPGRGILTEALAAKAGSVTAVELDRQLASRLQARWKDQGKVRIIHDDFLKTDLDSLWPGALRSPVKIFGNLPYSITSPIFEKILPWDKWRTGVFLVQREVGDRMRSAPGARTYGILSLAVQLFADVEMIAKVKPGAFNPPPKVMSMVVRIIRRKPVLPPEHIPYFFDLVHAAFAHRRKTLANSLAFFSDRPRKDVEKWLASQGVSGLRRAESFSLEEFVRLSCPWAFFRREMN